MSGKPSATIEDNEDGTETLTVSCTVPLGAARRLVRAFAEHNTSQDEPFDKTEEQQLEILCECVLTDIVHQARTQYVKSGSDTARVALKREAIGLFDLG